MSDLFASETEATERSLTRAIPPSLAPVVAELELQGADLVTTAQLDEIVRSAGIGTATRTVATRLRERGWLLPTGERGVWEFAPGAVAGPISRGGHTRPLRSVLAHTEVSCGLTFQAAAWAHGVADRAPARVEVAAASALDARRIHRADLDVSVFSPALGYTTLKDVPTLPAASVLVHMATSPASVRSWTSALEWIPDLAAEVSQGDVFAELAGRPSTVAARMGYLMQRLRPDIAERISRPTSKTWFGRRRPLVRHDGYWRVADTILPFDPRRLTPVSGHNAASAKGGDG